MLNSKLSVLVGALLLAGCPIAPVVDGGVPSRDGGIGLFTFDAGPGWNIDDDAGIFIPFDAGPGSDAGDAGVPSTVFVDSVTPPTGTLEGGFRVRVEGEGYTPESRVFFGDVEADQVIFISTRSVTCRVPPSTVQGPVTVRVEDPLGTGVLDGAFTYFSPVTLAAISPVEGTSVGGTALVATGAGFHDDMVLLVDGRQVVEMIVNEDGTSASFFSPPGSNAGRVDVEAVDAFGKSVLDLGYRYIDPLTLDSVSPAVVTSSDASILDVRGAGFVDDTTFAVDVSNAVVDNLVTSTRVRVVMPTGLAGLLDLSATSAIETVTLPEAIFVLSAEQGVVRVEGTVPSTGDVLGGGEILIAGELLTSTTNVTIGGQAAEFVVENDRTLVVTLPPGVLGPAEIVVTTDVGVATYNGFSYVTPLSVTLVSPNVGTVDGGTAVTITGRAFAAPATVTFGGLLATDVVVVDDTTITAVTPPGSSGVVNVTVEQVSGSATGVGVFRFSAGLSVLGISPPRGGISGGTFATVTGSGFFGGVNAVFVGALPASDIVVLSDNKLTCRTPQGAPGIVDVIVQKPLGTGLATGAFTFFDPTFLVGGTRGGPVDGAIYVTALDSFTSLPVPNLVAFLGTDGNSDVMAVTNFLGQATLSGPSVEGPQTVSVVGDGYEYASLVDVDASEVTLYLQPLNLVSGPPGPGPVPPPPATIRGRVFGFAKELFDPAALAQNEIALAIVTTTARDEFSGVPPGGTENVVFQEGGEYFISNSRPGRLAVVALAGIFNLDSGAFRFRQMGVRRNVYPAFGVNLEDQDIELTVPLDETVEISLPDAPVKGFGPATITRVIPFLRFGGEGALAYTTAIGANRNHEILAMPEIPGELMTFIAGAYSTDGPRSLVTDQGTVTIDPGLDVVLGDGTNWGATDFAGNPIVEGAIFVIEYPDGTRWATEVLTAVNAETLILDEKPPFAAADINYHIGDPSYPSSEVVQDGTGSLSGGVTISPVLGLPEPLSPVENGVMGEERLLRWKAAPGQIPSMHWMYVYDPINFNVLWTFYIDGTRTKVPVPRIPDAAYDLVADAPPNDPPAGLYYWQHVSMYAPGFEYTNWSYLDIGRSGRRSWTTDVHQFIYSGE